VSPQIRGLLCGTLGFPGATTLTLTNGIDTASFAGGDGAAIRAELGLGSRRVVTCVGRLIPGKGQAVLLDAFARIRQRYPETVLLLVGDGPERAALEARVRALDLHGAVSFARQRRDIPAVLAATDVFVLPSFAEGIPLSLLEAMAAGVPVVATAVPGNSNVIAHEGLGHLVPPRDPGAIAAAVTRLLDAPHTARRIGTAGQEHVRRHFDLAVMVRETTALYDAVLVEHGARRGRAAA
jgi:glycosyltransferase involved in cell wall biosynthesis